MRRVAAALLAGVALAACGGDQAEEPPPRLDTRVPAVDERVIRGWSRALNAGDFDRAAAYFERGAIIDQGQPFRLLTLADAIEFNSGLPCRGHVRELLRVQDATIARFALSEGHRGDCKEGGSATVRFVIRRAHIQVFEQFAEPTGPPAGSDAA
jgi:hypothetical protein